MIAYALEGLGCPCQEFPLGNVANYDVITIAGKQYSANQILDRDLIASRDVVLYRSLFKDDGKFTVKAGQRIGKVYTYLRPDNVSNPTGKVVLQFLRRSVDGLRDEVYWLKDDNAVSTQALKDQGTLTVKEEVKQEQAEQLKQNSPLEYYIKTYGGKALLIGGGIFLAGVVIRAVIARAGKKSEAKTEPQTETKDA